MSSQQPSWAIKNTLSQWARVQLPPILAKICDEQIEANQWYSLDKVELDLGVITLPAEPQQVIEQIATAFSQALAEQLQNFRPAAIMKRDENAQALRTLDYFIKTGTRPWWVSKDTVALTQCLLRLIDRTPARLREKLCHYLAQAATLQRLIAQCSDDQLLALSRLLAQNDHVELWCQQISAPLHRAFTREQFAAMALRSAYWQAIELAPYFMMYTNLMTYPLKFRQHVLAIKEKEKLTYAKTASRFGVGMASLMRWNRRITPCTTHNKPATKIDMEALAQDVATYPDDYQYERAQRFGVSAQGIRHALKRLRVSRKKNTSASQS
ncbi:contractile injection system tape measure protein [Candidatus Regiella insecticola]|uniref:contractile injection system tape measure protein n=1 Tax=Candidatus Regiella insecticola TaxID=138073 RepID=UPI00387E4F5A